MDDSSSALTFHELLSLDNTSAEYVDEVMEMKRLTAKLPPEIQAKIISEAIVDDNLVSKMADVLEEEHIVNERVARAERLRNRELPWHLRVQENTNPNSVVDLELAITNAHTQLWTGAQYYIDYFNENVDKARKEKQHIRNYLNMLKSRFYQHQLMINRLRNY